MQGGMSSASILGTSDLVKQMEKAIENSHPTVYAKAEDKPAEVKPVENKPVIVEGTQKKIPSDDRQALVQFCVSSGMELVSLTDRAIIVKMPKSHNEYVLTIKD